MNVARRIVSPPGQSARWLDLRIFANNVLTFLAVRLGSVGIWYESARWLDSLFKRSVR